MEDGLEARVEKLERENRNLKRGGLVALVLGGIAVLMGQTSLPKVSDEVRTRVLVVVDEAGNRRASLGTSKDETALVLFDDAGVRRAKVAASSDTPGLWFFDEAGRQRAILGTAKDGPILALADEAGKMRFS